MKPSAFRYVAPSTVEEAIDALQNDFDDAKILAGGQSLVPMMNMRLARPEILVDLNTVPDLDYLEPADGVLHIGALVRYADVEMSPDVASWSGLLHTAVSRIGYSSVRNRGTIGGNVAHHDPAGTMPAVLACLGGSVTVQGPGGSRDIDADDLFVGMYETDIEEDEILTEVRVPLDRPGVKSTWQTVQRKSGAYPTVGIAASGTVDDGAVTDISLTLIGVSDRPVKLLSVTDMLVGEQPTSDLLHHAGETARSTVDLPGDANTSASYKRDMLGVLTVRALRSVFDLQPEMS